MIKPAILVLFAYLTIVSSIGFNYRERFNVNRHPGNENEWKTKLCKNDTSGETFIMNIRTLITTLEGNDSYAQFIQKHAKAIAYIKDNTKMDLISANCTQYFNGLNNARKLDKHAEAQQEKFEENAQNLFRQILRSMNLKFFDIDF